MNKLKLVLTCLFTIFFLYQGFSQTRIIKGRVVSAGDNSELAGATVTVKGSSATAITHPDGTFSIAVPAGSATLVVTTVGFDQKEISVPAGAETVSVEMARNNKQLDEVVVTALGVKREKRALTFATQEVSGNELRKAANINFVDALSGKAAGLDIKVSNSGAGGSTKAILRGNKSLTGLSEALYVIDGIPLVNNKGGQPGSYGGNDEGDGLSAINPSDIESINVLRGANSAILYGSQGANGVILITTKKGKPGRMALDFDHSTIFDQVATLPDFQYKYGTVGGDYSWTPPATGTLASALVNISKSPINNVTSDSYQKGYIKDFFQLGNTITNSVSIAGGGDKTTAYFSYANVSSRGVVPNNKYQKNNFSFNQSTKFLDNKVTLSSNVIFVSEVSNNRPGAGYYNNPITGLYLFGRDKDFASYKRNYQKFDSTRNFDVMNWYSTEEKQNNPYWEINKDTKLKRSNRAIASVKGTVELLPGLRFEALGNVDYNEVTRDNRWLAGGNSVSVATSGTWRYARYTDQSLYTQGLFIYDKTFGNITLNALAGASYQKNIFGNGMNFNNGTVAMFFPDFFTFSNLPQNVPVYSTISRSIKEGVFGDVAVGFKDFLFLDVAARNDWASTLALSGNQSYLYPSAGVSLILSEMLKLPAAISYLKVRGSLSQTANDVPFNVVNPQGTVAGAAGGIALPTQKPFLDLKPEKIVSNEYGLESRFFGGRLGFDFTIYKDISTNQFLSLPAPSGSGYTVMYINAGKIENKGFELSLNAEPIRTRTLSWKTSINGSQNKNKIVELIPSNPDYQVGGDDEGFASIIKAGGSFNDVYIYKFARNDAGQIILDEKNAAPTKAATQEKVGNVNPDLLLGWNNTVTIGNFSFGALVNAKFGGVAFSKTEAFLDSYGVSGRTAAARDAGNVPINAILGSTAVTSIDPYTYYSAVGDRNKIMEPYVFSRTNVRLGQLIAGYTFTSARANAAFKSIAVSLIGRNLLFFYKKAPFDPEQSMSTDNSMQSNDVFSIPNTRSFGFNVKFTF